MDQTGRFGQDLRDRLRFMNRNAIRRHVAARVVSFASLDGLRLEGRLSVPDEPRGVAVLCHAPEPPGGLMPNVLMPSLGKALHSSGWVSLRFNYRGIGRSEGTFGSDGVSEPSDIAGAVEYVRGRFPQAPCAVIGWSTGAFMALKACIGRPEIGRFVAIAPPVSDAGHKGLPDPGSLSSWSVRTLLIAGTADPKCEPEDLRRLAETLGAEAEVLEGSDHGFSAGLADLGARITWFLR